MHERPPPCNPCEYGRPQDLPPPGGYAPIPYKRIPAKQLFSGYALFTAYVGITTGALFLYYVNYKKIVKHEIEMRSSRMAIYPMLLAERDREFMKQLRRNRDEEEKLMANVPGWKTGTYYGDRIFKMIEPDTYIEPIFHEYYIHSSPTEFRNRADLKLWS